MSKLTVILIVSLLMHQVSLMASSELFVCNLPFKEGVIDYHISGNERGKIRAYFRDYGKEIAIYENIKSSIMHENAEIKRATIIKKDTITSVNLNNNTATQKTPLRKMLLEIFSNLDKQNQEYILDYPSNEVLNIECVEIIIDGVKECRNGSLYLKKDLQIFGYNSHIVASKITKQEIDDRYFQLPLDIKLSQEEENWDSAKKIIELMLE